MCILLLQVLHVEAGNAEPDTASATDSGTVLSSDGSQTSQTAMLHNVSNTEQVGTFDRTGQNVIETIFFLFWFLSCTQSWTPKHDLCQFLY